MGRRHRPDGYRSPRSSTSWKPFWKAQRKARTEAAPLLADLLSIPFGERYPPLQLTEVVQKQRTMEVLEEQLVLLSSGGPVLVVFEDAHWIDPTSLELMDRVIRRVVDLPVMIIVTYRPEFTPPWLDLGHAYDAEAEPLGAKPGGRPHSQDRRRQDAARRRLSNRSPRSRRVSRCLSRRSRERFWNPAIWKRWRALRPATINSGLHNSVYVAGLVDCASGPPWRGQRCRAHGIDNRPGVFLRTARCGSAGVAGDAAGGLEQLVRSDLLGQRGVPPQSRYIFKHALIRDAAFQSVLNAKKRELHERIAEVSRKPVSRSCRDRARTAGAPLYGSKRG